MPTGEQIGLSDRGLRLVIIADDLTGALDAAAPFAEAGLAVRVATRPQSLAVAIGRAEVVGVSTRSREISPQEARATVVATLAAIPQDVPVFKKIDSRLKGNIAAELQAFGNMPLLAVPALPDFGRVVSGGAVRGWGVDKPIPVAQVLGRPAQVPDVTTRAEMEAALDNTPGHLVVGARGAAQVLATRMGQGHAQLPALGLPLVIAVGSTDPITLAQVAALRGGQPDLRYVAAADGQADASPAPGVTLVQAVPGQGASAAMAAKALAQTVARLVQGAQGLVLTGGATAEAALDALGIDVLDLHGEIQPGLPLSSGGGLRIVTKSGGFGDGLALLRLAQGAGR